MAIELDTGTQGAKRQSFRQRNPRAILKQIVDDNPGVSEDEIRNLLWEECLADIHGAMRNVFEYWCDNNYRPERHKPVYDEVKYRAKKAEREQCNTQAESFVVCAIEEISLEMIMPNGKALGDCAGREILSWGDQYTKRGRRLTKLGSALGLDQKARELTATEEALGEFLG